MIALPGASPAGSSPDRIVRALEARGHAFERGSAATAGATALLFPAVGQEREHERWIVAGGAASCGRLVVVTRLGTHPDARGALRDAWELEERARATGVATLTLRLAPLLGPECPLWRMLASGAPLPRQGRKLLNPVAESDAVETLDRALREPQPSSEWYEVAAPEVWSLAELARLARECGAASGDGGDWEPPIEELEAHKLAESGPWIGRFGVKPVPLAETARRWAAPAGSVR